MQQSCMLYYGPIILLTGEPLVMGKSILNITRRALNLLTTGIGELMSHRTHPVNIFKMVTVT